MERPLSDEYGHNSLSLSPLYIPEMDSSTTVNEMPLRGVRGVISSTLAIIGAILTFPN